MSRNRRLKQVVAEDEASCNTNIVPAATAVFGFRVQDLGFSCKDYGYDYHRPDLPYLLALFLFHIALFDRYAFSVATGVFGFRTAMRFVHSKSTACDIPL